MKSQRHKELGDFLKKKRQQISPEDVGINPHLSRRHVKGLRREEVATLSGVSLTWYTYLEQGRSINVSEQVLNSIANVLQLNEDERNYLFTLTNRGIQTSQLEEENDETVSSSLRMIIDELISSPAFIIKSGWNVLAWNRMAAKVFGDYAQIKKENRKAFLDWEYVAKRMLAKFRSYYGKNIDNTLYTETIEKLKQESVEFKEWWERHEVIEARSGQKEFCHEKVGVLSFEHNIFNVAGNSHLLLIVFTPNPKTDTKEKLLRL